jgi:hypothetical protein
MYCKRDKVAIGRAGEVSHGALWAVLEGFRVPDVDWLKQLYAKLTVRLKGEADAGSSMVLEWPRDMSCHRSYLFCL